MSNNTLFDRFHGLIEIVEEFDASDAVYDDNFHNCIGLEDIIAVEEDIATYAKVKAFRFKFDGVEEYTNKYMDLNDIRWVAYFKMMEEWSHFDDDHSAVINYAYRGGPVTEIWINVD